MSIKKNILVAGAVILSLTANAQSNVNTHLEVNNSLKTGRYERKISRFDQLKLTNSQIKSIGERFSANGLPTKESALKMLKAANIGKASKRKTVAKSARKANYTAADTIFWDSFEGWDGKTLPWLPSDNKWSTKSNIENLTPYLSLGQCPTWTAFKGDGYYIPYARDGYQFIVCMFGDDVYGADGTSIIAPAPQQDEWLVSPAINAIKGTNYLSFDINYAPWDSHFFVDGNDSVFDPKRIAYDVEVLITTSTRSASYDAANYKCVYKISDEVDKLLPDIDLNDAESSAQLLYTRWQHVQIPLKEYDGNNIRIAFRYTGTKGGSVIIDALRVSDLLPVAMFDRPEGSFYLGHSDQGASLTGKFAVMPAYRESVWKNYSNEDAHDYEWRYNVNGTSGTSKETDLLLPASKPTGFENWPTLQANSGLRSDVFSGGEFSGIKSGGDGSIRIDESVGVIRFTLGNYDPTKFKWFAGVGTDGSAFGTGGGGYWSDMTNGQYVAVNGIANIFEAPTSPYIFNQVVQVFDDFFDLGAKLACTVYRVTDDGSGILTVEDEVIAQTMEFKDNDLRDGGHAVVFSFKEPMIIDTPIAISIEGLDDSNLLTALPLAQALNHDSNKGYGFVLLRTAKGGISWKEIAGALSQNEGAGNMAMSFCMGMNAIFPYIGSNDGDVYSVPKEGGEKSFDLETYWNPNGMGKEAVDPKWKVTCSESWFEAETIVNDAEQTVNIKITADELPASVKGRNGIVNISALGCSYDITVLQGDAVTAIESLNANGSGNAEGTYTISGQRINSADAKKGIFLQKKNGKYVKVIK